MENTQKTHELMLSTDDTDYGDTLERYQRIIGEEGFELACEIPFSVFDKWEKEERKEKHFIYFHRQRGILLTFDTYNTTSVNGGNFYYNVREKDRGIKPLNKVMSSGTYNVDADGKYILTGSHDCREGLRLHIRQLADAGEFLSTWLFDPRPWLANHGDERKLENTDWPEKGEAYDQIFRDRIAGLPDWVQKATNMKRE